MDENLRIREVAKDNGITLTEVAKRMGVSKGTLSEAVNGNPTINYLARVARAIGCETRDLIR